MVRKNDTLMILAVVAVLAIATGMIKLGTPGSIVAPPTGGSNQPSSDVLCPQVTTGFTQTLKNASYDYDQPGTAVGGASVIYLSPSTGELNAGGLTVNPGKTYTVLETASNYFGSVKTITTPCNDASPPVTLRNKAVDTAVTATVYNTDGITANSITGNMTIGASGSGTFHVKMSQSAAYKHLSGEIGKFAVFVNMSASNASDFDGSQFSATFDGVPCVAYGQGGLDNTATPAAFAGSSVLFSAVCTGDFAANDGAIHDLAVKVQATSGTNPGGEDLGIAWVGVDYYQNTLNNKIEKGAVKNSGAAIQAMQAKQVFVK